MKMNLTKVASLAVVFMLIFGFVNITKAQDEISNFILAGSKDASKILESYTAPFLKGFGHGINAGWNNTAKPHKLLGFDLTVTVAAARVPQDETFFTFRSADYERMRLSSGASEAEFPTIFGPSETQGLDEITLRYEPVPGQGIESSFVLPGLGIEETVGFNFVPVPMVSFGVGLIKGTEVRFRYVPTLEFEGLGSIGMFGFGVKHDVKQWIPGIKHLPFDLSGFFGFTNFKTAYAIDSYAGTQGTSIEIRNPLDNQNVNFSSNGTVLQGLISKKLLFLTPYAGIGFTRMSTQFNVAGDYDIWVDNGNGTYEQRNPENANQPMKDPITLKVSEGSMQALVGVRVKILWVLAMHAEYTFQKYNTFTFGVGLNIR